MSSSEQSANSEMQKEGIVTPPEGMTVTKWPPSSVVMASVTFHWPLSHMCMLMNENCVSDPFTAAGYKFRLKFRAKSSANKNTSVEDSFASLYIESIDAKNGISGPLATFFLGVINQDFPEQSLWRPCQHVFTEKVTDWGFSKLIALSDLIDPKRGFVVNDRLILAVRF